MAATIKDFLVGVGLDTKEFDEGSKNVVTNLGRIRSFAAFAGTALVGAFAAAGAGAIAAGQRIDSFTLSTERMSTSTGFVYNFGSALRMMGGEASEASAAINSFESALDQLKQGNYPFEDLNRAGIDTSAIVSAQDGAEVTRILAEIVPTLNQSQQRILQENFGLSDATMRLLRQGSQEFDALLARSASLTGDIGDATDAARAYNKEMSDLQLRFEGIGNALADKMLPSMAGILSNLNTFIDGNEQRIKAASDVIGANPVGSGLVAGGLAAGAGGAVLSGLGLKTAGATISRFGLPGAAIGAGLMAWDVKPDDIEGVTGYRPDDYIFNNTPADAARSAYNWGAGKIGLPGVGPANGTGADDIADSFGRFQGDIIEKLRNRSSGIVADEEILQATSAGASVNQYQNSVDTVRAAPQRIQNNLDIRLEMDGRAIETKIVEVTERRGQATMDDLQSTTVR